MIKTSLLWKVPESHCCQLPSTSLVKSEMLARLHHAEQQIHQHASGVIARNGLLQGIPVSSLRKAPVDPMLQLNWQDWPRQQH